MYIAKACPTEIVYLVVVAAAAFLLVFSQC
jgi:hypothetical protein